MERMSLSVTSAKHLDRGTGVNFPTYDEGVIHVYETSCLRGSPITSKSLPLDAPCSLEDLPTGQDVALKVGAREDSVHVGRFGDGFGSAAYAVVYENTDSDFLHVFLAVPDKDLPFFLAVDPNDSSVDVAKMVKGSRQRSSQSRLCLLREGQVLSNASLADNGVQELSVLQWVKVEEKLMEVIYYQKPDVRRKFRPRVRNISSVREILSALEESLRESNLCLDLDTHNLRLSAESTLFRDENYYPHIDVLGKDGHVVSRRVDSRYFTLHVCPKEEQELTVSLTYRRGCDKNLKERKAVVIVPLGSSVRSLRDNVARFVSLKQGHAIKLSQENGMLRLSDEVKVSSIEGIINNCCTLYAELVPAIVLYVDVESVPSGHKTSVVEHAYEWSSVADLKKSVASKLETDPGLLHLEHKSRKMDEKGIIQDSGLKDKNRIQCRFYQRGMILVVVLGVDIWHQILIEDATKTTVGELQKWLQSKLHSPADMILVQHGRPLDSGRSLLEAGVAMGARLSVVRLNTVSHESGLSGPYRRIFEVDGQGVHGERFAFVHPGHGLPFYAPQGTKQNQLPPQAVGSVPEPSVCKELIEGIQILRSVTPETRSQEPSLLKPSQEREGAGEGDSGNAGAEMISLTHSRHEGKGDSVVNGGVYRAEVVLPQQAISSRTDLVDKTGKDSTHSSFPAELCCPGAGGDVVVRGSCTPTAVHLTEKEMRSTFGVDVREVPCPDTAAAAGCPVGASVAAADQPSNQHVLSDGQTRGHAGIAQNQTSPTTATPSEPRNLPNKLPSKIREFLPSPIAEEGCHDSTDCKAARVGLDTFADYETSGVKPQEHQKLGIISEPKVPQSHRDHSTVSEGFNTTLSNSMLVAGSTSQDQGACSGLLPTNQGLHPGEMPFGDDQHSYKRVNFSSREVLSVLPANSNGQPDVVVQRSFSQQVWSKGDVQVELCMRQPSQPYSPLGENNAGSSFPLDAASPASDSSSPTEPDQVPDHVLKKVAEQLGRDWGKVCLDLGVKSQDIEVITSRHPNDLFEQAFGGLKKWRRARGRQATLATLRSCLEKNELVSIAELIPP